MPGSGRHLSDRALWRDISPDILELILEKVSKALGWKCLASLLLVSKEWSSAALKAFSGSLKIRIVDPASQILTTLSRTLSLSRLSGLEIHVHGIQHDLSAISSCSRLNTLRIVHHPATAPYERLLVDLRAFPASLLSLKTSSCCIDEHSLEHIRFARLTELSILGSDNTTASICLVLQGLADLKVLEVSTADANRYYRSSIDVRCFLRVTTLTHLRITVGSMPLDVTVSLSLEELVLEDISLSTACLTSIYNSSLTKVELDGCELEMNYTRIETVSAANDTLKCLTLSRTPLQLLPLGAPGLRELQCKFVWGQNHISRIAPLSGLTRLYISSCSNFRGMMEPCKLPLRELCLHDCPGAETALLVPDALTSLTRLDINESARVRAAFRDVLAGDDPEGQPEVQKLREAAAALESLPDLSELRGTCRLFDLMSRGQTSDHLAYMLFKADLGGYDLI